MSAQQFIIDVSAATFARVAKFAAQTDSMPCLGAVQVRCKFDSVALCASNGTILYVERDVSGKCGETKLLRFSKGASAFLKGNNRVRLSADGTLAIYDASRNRIFVEPDVGVLDSKYPDIAHLIGDPAQWKRGLQGSFNTQLLKPIVSMEGCIHFWNKGGKEGDAALFTIKHHGARGFGVVMPMRDEDDTRDDVLWFVPPPYRPEPAPAAAAETEPVLQNTSVGDMP